MIMNRFIGVLVCLALAGCSDEAPAPPKPGARAKPKTGDPKLSRSWKMAAKHSPMSDGDLGSDPDTLAEALYGQGMPGVTHRIAKQCADSGALKATASVALRFTVDDAGKIGAAIPDPPGAAGTCVADAFAVEAAKLDAVPAGTALLRIKFHPTK